MAINWGGGASGAMSGAATGSMFGPIGTGIGAAAGGLWGLFGGRKKKPSNSPDGIPILGQSTPGVSGTMATTAGLDNTDRTLENRGDTFWDDYLGARQRDQDLGADVNRGYGKFAETGGYDPTELANIRSRATGTVRSIFDSSRRNIERSRNLSGFAPNYAASMAKIGRDQAGAVSDAATNADANIAQLVHGGKLAGLSGMAGMYGATPGQTNMFANQAGGADRNWLNLQNLRTSYDQSERDRALRAKQLPTGLDRGLGRAGSIMDLIGRGASVWSGMRR